MNQTNHRINPTKSNQPTNPIEATKVSNKSKAPMIANIQINQISKQSSRIF